MSASSIIKKTTSSSNKGWKGLLIPLLLFLLAVYFWNSIFVLPIKYLTVFFHELSHGLAAIITGGEIVKIQLTTNEGGVCFTRGGSRFIILSAGYLGSLLWGAAILLAAAKTKHDKHIASALGILLLAVAVIWVRNFAGLAICILSGAALIAIGKYATQEFCDTFLKFLGLTSCFYVIIDIKSDLIDRSIPCSDAYKISEMLHMPDWLVGGIWLLLAIIISWKVLQISLK